MRFALALLLLCACSLGAQTRRVAPRPDAYLTISVTKTNASVTLSIPSERNQPRSQTLLASSVTCEQSPAQPLEQDDDAEEPFFTPTVFCRALSHTGAGRALHMDLIPLRQALQERGFQTVYVYLAAPSEATGLPNAPLRTSSRGAFGMVSGNVAVRELPPSIDIRLERPAWKLPAFLASLFVLFTVPLLASGFTSRHARLSTGPVSDRWFGLYLCITLRAIWVWLGLWLLCTSFGGFELLGEILAPASLHPDAIVYVVLVTLAVAVNCLCSAMEAPRYRDVRNLPITNGEILRIELLKDLCIALAPLPFFYAGQFLTNPFAGLVLPLAATLIVVALAGNFIRKTIGIRPFAASRGELRDAVFQLAARGGVALKNLYVLPVTKWKLVNAFASRGDHVMLSQALVEALSKREVEALAAHELTHVKETHLRKIGLLTGTFFVLCIGFGVGVTLFYFRDNAMDVVPFTILALWLVSPAIRRRYEWKADAGAAALTGDPEAVITGLVKITRLNCMPLRFGRPWCWLMTHPSSIRRVQAIARLYNIPQERLSLLINADLEDDEPRYSIDAAETSDARIFNTEYKTRSGLALLFGLLFVLVAAPVAVTFAASRLHGWMLRIGLEAAALALIPMLDRFVVAWIHVRQIRRLGALIRSKLARGGALHPEQEAVFVTLIPSSSLRLYEGRYEWDVGYLWLAGGRLRYRGELASFDLAPADLAGTSAPEMPFGLSAARNLYLTVRTAGGQQTIGIRPLGHLTTRQARVAFDRLAGRIAAWSADGSAFDAQPASLLVPRESDVTSQSLRQGAAVSLRASVIFAGIAIAVAGMIPGVPIDTYLLIPAVAAISGWSRIWPQWRYRPDSSAVEYRASARSAAP